ncbi:MAG: Type 1 glutamine amidotransferase-like domain-containing protein [Candidatus Nanopelagicales bacterium]
MHVSLIGGGRDMAWAGRIFEPFVTAASDVASRRGASEPRIAIVLLDEGEGVAVDAERFTSALRQGGAVDPLIVAMPLGRRLYVPDLIGCDGLFVGGGLTPGYVESIVPTLPDLLRWLRQFDAPYAGFSAGAAIAAESAVIGGWLHNGIQVCPEDASEDLEEVTIVAGLGLVPFTVEVHADTWETTPRLGAALQRLGRGAIGYAIDENTALVIDGDSSRTLGAGRATRLENEATHEG